MKTERMINALFAMVEAKMEIKNCHWTMTAKLTESLETAKQEFDKAFMEAVDSHIKETSKN